MSNESNLTPENVNNTLEMETDSVDSLIPTAQLEERIDSNQNITVEQTMHSCESNDQNKASELSQNPENPNVDVQNNTISPEQSLLPSDFEVSDTIPTNDPEEKLGLESRCDEAMMVSDQPVTSVGELSKETSGEKSVDEVNSIEMEVIGDENKETTVENAIAPVLPNTDKSIEAENAVIHDDNKETSVEGTMSSDLPCNDKNNEAETVIIHDENMDIPVENITTSNLPNSDKNNEVESSTIHDENKENPVENTMTSDLPGSNQNNEAESAAIHEENMEIIPVASVMISDLPVPNSEKNKEAESAIIHVENKEITPVANVMASDLANSDKSTCNEVENVIIHDETKESPAESLKTLELPMDNQKLIHILPVVEEVLKEELLPEAVENKPDNSEKSIPLPQPVAVENKTDISEMLLTLPQSEAESTAFGNQNTNEPVETAKTLENDDKPIPAMVELPKGDQIEPVVDEIVQNSKENPILMAQLLKGSGSRHIPGETAAPRLDSSEPQQIAPFMTRLFTGNTNKPSQPETPTVKELSDDEQISHEKREHGLQISDSSEFVPRLTGLLACDANKSPQVEDSEMLDLQKSDEKPRLPIGDKNEHESEFVPSMTGLLANDENKSPQVEDAEMFDLKKRDEKIETPPEPMEEDHNENDPSNALSAEAIAQSADENPVVTELKGDKHIVIGKKVSLSLIDQEDQVPTVPSLTLGLFSSDAHKQPATENPIMAELRKNDQKKHLTPEPSLTLGLLAGSESSEAPDTLGLLQDNQNKQKEPGLTLGLLTGDERNPLLSEQALTLGLLSSDKSKPLSTEPNSAMESEDCSPNRSELVPPVTCFEEDTRSSWNFDASKSTSLKELPRNIDENAQTSMHGPAKDTLLVVKPMDEDSRVSVGSQKSSKRRLSDDEGSLFPAERLFEYQWPAGKGEFYLLQEHVSEFLVVKSFKRKYPEFGRRPVDIDERRFLRDCGVVSETQCDLGLTAVRSDDVLELMSKDYPDKYQEYLQVLQERERQKINSKHKEYATALVDKTKINDFLKKAINSAAEYNAHLNQERREERKTSFDLQTYTVHIPASKIKKLDKEATKVGSYPVALLSGQYQDSYRVYNSEEMKYLPMNTVLYGPLKEVGSIYAQPSSDGSQSDSEDSCASGSCCSSSQGTQDGSIDSSSSSEQPRPTKSRSDYVGDAPYKPKDKPNAQCKVCHSSSERNKEGRPEELVHCSECESSGHPSCLELTAEMVVMVKSYPWQCMDCKTCMLCMDPYDEDKMMFCDKCDRGYHTFCVGLKSIPSGRWICQLCGQCATCGSRTPGPEGSKVQWHQEIQRSGTPNGEPVKQLFCANCAKQRKCR